MSRPGWASTAAQALYQLSRHGTEFVRREIAEGDPSIKMGDGWQGCIRYSNAAEKQAAVAEMARDYGQEMQFLDVAETRARVNTQRYFQSSYDPIRLPHASAALCADDRGEGGGGGCAALREFARRCRSRGRARRGRCARRRARCGRRNVVYCVSSLDRALHPPTGRAVLPVATYVAVTEPLTQDVIRTRSAISDSRRAGNYYRLVDEGRLLWGGAITTRVSEPARLAERMKGDMVSVFP